VSRPKLNLAGGGVAAIAVAIALVPALSGCGVSSKGDFNRGKQLFAAVCAQCHTLRDAGSSSTQGPDLDAAFAQARAHGMDPETISGVVKNQVENPRPPQPGAPNPYVTMPPDLLKGENLDDVASYIGTVAGNPAFKGPQLPNDPGALVFLQNGCAGCHTLEAAGSTGTVGPDLDQAIGKGSLKTTGQVKTAIVDPDKKIAPGFPAGVMPSTFEDTIPAQEMDQLVQFLVKCAGNASDPACQPSGGKSSGSSNKSG
jgi:mono/diheme cytochrome c family protein